MIPNIDAPTIGRASPSGGLRDLAMAAIAAAAFEKIRALIRLIPAMSATEYIIVTSVAPT